MSKKTIIALVLSFALLMVASVAITAFTAGERRAEITTHVKDVSVHIWKGPVSKAVVWDNGMNYIGLGASQSDPASGLDPIIADDFQFDADQLVNDVHWIGGYYTGPPNDGDFDWEIKFYHDNGLGTTPGVAIATYTFANADVNETFIEYIEPTDPDYGAYYSYSVRVPKLYFSANTKYWISIQGIGGFPPQSGWAIHDDPILLHQAVFKSVYFGFPNWTNTSTVFGIAVDACFQLTFTHKMHFPQMPDLIGWDVNAVNPKTLADDWQCSQTGPVEDIHFWGSWKNIDGDPWTDDFYTEMPWFGLSIHRNIPATPEIPWSRPGEMIWWWDGEILGIPYEPPTLEAWFDPNTGEVIPNDHVPYWQYDFYFDEAYPPPDPFIQYEDSIYWLNISVHPSSSPDPFRWGWKNSRDHFMDDAVYTDTPPAGPWYPLVEPPRQNWFEVWFGPTGYPEDYGSTNYYGEGWYRYEYWWNIWFYDNPFTYDQPKEMFLDFYIEPAGPEYYVEFAINWSTDIWSLEGVPGRPPLPEDGNEEYYIGREFFGPLPPGPYSIPFTLPYNPEWVSIDFVAYDAFIAGWIWHECVQTSMDLAFVITGPECTPSIDVEKKVWDETLGEYVDSTDIDSCSNADFLITIHNDGTCCDLTGINVVDFMDASLEYLTASPPPDWVDPTPTGTLIGWSFPGPLEPCNTIEISVVAHVIGPPCHTDSNSVDVDAFCEASGVEVYDHDVAYVHATPPPCEPSIDVEKKVWDEENEDWVDFTDIDSCSNADFKITVHNNGTCCDLTEILVSDCVDSSLDYQYADPPPDRVEPYPGGVCLEWDFPGPLSPCNTYEITVTYHAVGPPCHVDTNWVGANGYCESTGEWVYDQDMAWVHVTAPEWPNHKMHFPQEPDPEGYDVVATMGYDLHPGIVVADDFMCTKTLPILDIHFWGSWLYNEEVPIHGFFLSIHDNVIGPPSHPGEELWSAYITDYEMVPMEPHPQGWFDPFEYWWEPFNHDMWYRYDITDIPDPFCQDSGTIYWLNVMADIGPIGYQGFPEPPLWGWKTSVHHWMDDAVWAIWTPPYFEWIPLYDPITGMTLDMAFVITGEAICGDLNLDGIIDLGDVLFLISYLYKGGLAPCPIDAADVNCDGIVDLGDLLYLISYLYKGGFAPCDIDGDGIPDCSPDC